MNIALIDDMESQRIQMVEFLREYERNNGLSFSIDCFSCGEDFLNVFEEYKYNLVFTDVFMCKMKGTEVADIIRKRDKSCVIVFLTISDEFMPQAFSCHAFDYIKKPVSKERVFNVMSDLFNIVPNMSKYIRFTIHRQSVKVLYSEIVCIVSAGHNSEITHISGKTYSPNIGFTKLIKPLMEDNRFLHINRGIIVNMEHIIEIKDNICRLSGNICLAVRVRESSRIERIWQNYNFSQIHAKLTQRRTPNDTL